MIFNLPTKVIQPGAKLASCTRVMTKKMLIPMTTTLSMIATNRLTKPLAKSPMIALEDENAIVGMVAKGS